MRTAIGRHIFCGLLIVVLASMASSAFARVAPVDYVNPPDFTPQRTLCWEFDSASWETPLTLAGPAWGTGEMSGDSITHSDNMQFYTGDMWAGHYGMIGYDNTNGTEAVDGWLSIHISNFNTPNPVKYIWGEVEATQWGAVVQDGLFTGPEGAALYHIKSNDVSIPGGGRSDMKWSIHPNPSWEVFTWTFHMPAGTGMYVDKFFLSTACVPEPSALMALGTGLVGLIGFASRKRRA